MLSKLLRNPRDLIAELYRHSAAKQCLSLKELTEWGLAKRKTATVLLFQEVLPARSSSDKPAPVFRVGSKAISASGNVIAQDNWYAFALDDLLLDLFAGANSTEINLSAHRRARFANLGTKGEHPTPIRKERRRNVKSKDDDVFIHNHIDF